MKKLQLLEFYKNIIDTIDVWFSGKEPTEKTEYITNFVFSCGVYGKQELSFASSGLKTSKTKKHVKVVKFFELLFPTWMGMVSLYPILKKIPILLPVMYIVRWIEVLLFRRKNIKINLGRLKEYSKENIDNYQKHLNYVGLDFNFKEEK